MQRSDGNRPQDKAKSFQSSFGSVDSTLVSEPTSKLPNSSDSRSSVARCLDCEQKFASQELEEHLLTCPFAKRTCSIDRCRFEGSDDKFLQHMISNHAQDLLSTFTRDTFLNVAERSKLIYDNDPIIFKINGAKVSNLLQNIFTIIN